jgi:putative hemolysin
MGSTAGNVALVLLFVLVGGVFAATEIALVSLRDSQIRALSERGRRGARVAHLAADPNRFLAAVQIGVTVAGFFSAAFGAATLADDVAPVLEGWGLSQAAAQTTALVTITLVVAYLSLVLGELVPKRLALQRAEAVALVLAPPLDVLATLVRPVIWLLSVSTNLLVRLLGGDPGLGRDQISSAELRELVTAHEEFSEQERRIVTDVFEAGERQIKEVMVPRTEVEFLPADLPVATAVRHAVERPHSRYPVADGSPDDVTGFVHVRDLLDPSLVDRRLRVAALTREVLFLPGTKPVLASLNEMQRTGSHLAIVVDEYGGTAGIVTLEDLVEELVGDIRDEYDEPGQGDRIPRLGDVDGLLNLDEFADRTGIVLPEGPYETVAGYLVCRLGRIPAVGSSVEVDGRLLEVLSLDGRRVERVRVSVLPTGDPDVPPAAAVDDPASPDEGTPVDNPDHVER